jgi:hypothetical protein
MLLAILDFATNWLGQHQGVVWAIVGFSLVMVVGAAVALPYIVVRIPADYFAHDRPPQPFLKQSHPALRITAIAAKNLLGALLLIAGLVMLFTPGQGILCVLLGVALLDVPGKRRLERWIATRPTVFKAINALRRKYHKPPLEKPHS